MPGIFSPRSAPGWWILFLVCCRVTNAKRAGDLLEAGESAWQSLLGVLGLIVRREATLWKTWQPWLAAFGLALPSSFLLMGFSLSVSRAYQQLAGGPILHATGIDVRQGFALFLCNVVLLAAWSWTGGFVVGSVSRRTVWVSAALSFIPCLFCLERFRIESLSRLCLLLFLPIALWGARRVCKWPGSNGIPPSCSPLRSRR